MVNWKNMMLFFISLFCLLSGIIGLNIEVNYNLMMRLAGLGIVLAVILYLRLFLRKNYIGYTGTGMVVRTGRHGGKMFRFQKLKDASIDKGLLQLDMKNGLQLVVDLDDADPREIGKLRNVLEKKFQ